MFKQTTHNQLVEFLNTSHFKALSLVQVHNSLSAISNSKKSWKTESFDYSIHGLYSSNYFIYHFITTVYDWSVNKL